MFRFLTLSILFTFFSLASFAGSLPADSINKTDAKGRKQGTWIKSDAGVLKYKGCFKDDKPVGRFTYYHTNGKVKAISDYSDQGKVSRTQLFDLEGMLEASGKYIDRQKDSTWTFYFKGGEKISSTEDWKSGKKNGITKTYFISGKPASECAFINDNPEGPCKEYFTNGNIKKEYSFQNGTLHGTFKLYFLNGVPEQVGKYEQGLRNGEWIEYLETGKIKMRKTFKNGNIVSEKKENGSFTDYYDSGMPMLEVNYSGGKKEGPFREFYDIGTWKKVEIPAEDSQSGTAEMKEVLEGQRVKREGTYQADKLQGKVISYDEKGTVTKTENYKEGVLVK